MQDHFDTFELVYEERFAKRYGFWLPHLKEVIYRYLECGDVHRGFARLVCQTCGRNFLLAYSVFYGLGMFRVAPKFTLEDLEKLFPYHSLAFKNF